MNILIYDPYVDAVTLPEGVTAVKFDRLLAESDVISLHCVATPQTKGMFGKAQFDAMSIGERTELYQTNRELYNELSK